MEYDLISHPNTRTLHYGNRDDGAKCGQPSDSWATVDAEHPLDAVVTYATPACCKCFPESLRLNTVYRIDHSALVVGIDREKVIRRLPWDEYCGMTDEKFKEYVR